MGLAIVLLQFIRALMNSPWAIIECYDIAHHIGRRVAFMGKVGRDELGEELVFTMNKESTDKRLSLNQMLSYKLSLRFKCEYEN